MLSLFFKISRPLRYSTPCAIANRLSHLFGLVLLPINLPRLLSLQIRFFHPCRLASLHPSSRAICTTLLPLWITISTAWLCIAPYTLGALLFFCSIGPLSFFGSRVRQIGEVSGNIMSEFLFIYRGGDPAASHGRINRFTKWTIWLKELTEKGHIKDPGHPSGT